jgi:hypothetical protein
MQILSVELWSQSGGEGGDVFSCRIILEPNEYVDLFTILTRTYDSATMKTEVVVLVKGHDELDAYKKVPALVNKGEDRAFRNRS